MPCRDDHFLFFAERIDKDRVFLGRAESRHLHAALRMGEGDEIHVTDGRGGIYICRVEKVDWSGAEGTILDRRSAEQTKPDVHLYAGIPEKDAFEDMLETLVPLGVVSINPVECEFCDKKWWAGRWERYVERFGRKLIAAAKQSWNPFLPGLRCPVSFDRALQECEGGVLYADEGGKFLSKYQHSEVDGQAVNCFIGPPGGFSEGEIEHLESMGGVGVKLSRYRLRTELAATLLTGMVLDKYHSSWACASDTGGVQ